MGGSSTSWPRDGVLEPGDLRDGAVGALETVMVGGWSAFPTFVHQR